MIRPSSSPPAAPILCFGRIHAGLPYATASPTQRRGARKTNDCCISHSLQPVTCFPDGPPRLRISGVCFQALPRCVHCISRSLQLCFRLGVSTPTSSWPPSFLGRDRQFSGPHDGCGECGFYVIHIAVSRRFCPEMPSNCCGHLLSKLGISHQASTVHWWLS